MTGAKSTEPGPRKSGLAGLEAAARGVGKARGPAPVHLWNPPYCGDIGLRIGADGCWSYRGSVIRRQALVELFASVLRKDEDGRHYLVTPVEKIAIEVEDAPFLAVAMHREGKGRDQRLTFRTNVNDELSADAEHPLRFDRESGTDGLKPYVLVRGRLEARLTRALAYDLVAAAGQEGDRFGVWSGGVFFPIAAADEVFSD